MSLYKEKLGGGGDLAPSIHFKTSKAISEVNFFEHDANSGYDFSALQVYINDKFTNIPANALTANAGDDIRIVSRSDLYPFFYPSEKDYIASIEEPLPFMGETDLHRYFYNCQSLASIPQGLFDNNPNVTDFDYCFAYCRALTAIPQRLFDNNIRATSFYHCFEGCSALTSIPDGLFDKNTNAVVFAYCFGYCTALTSIPIGLFDKNTRVTNFTQCFYHCENLTVIVQIGCAVIFGAGNVAVANFARGTAAKGTVYCRAGSAAYNSFKAITNANVNVLTY